MPPLRTPIALLRAMRLACHLGYGALLAIPYPHFAPAVRQRILKQWSAELLAILGVRIDTAPAQQSPSPARALLLANHISWLDVFVLNAHHPCCFVAKSEVEHWPLIGILCRRTSTLFIDRRNRHDTVRVNTRIGELLGRGESVALFPEGTSSDGSRLLHFHSSLLQSACDCQSAVHPLAIRYHDGSGKHCSDPAFIGDMSFLQSLLRVLSSPHLHAAVHHLPELETAGKNRRILAAEAHAAIELALATPIAYSHLKPTDDQRQVLAGRSAYSLLLDPVFKLKKRSG